MTKALNTITVLALGAALTLPAGAQVTLDRTALPIHEPTTKPKRVAEGQIPKTQPFGFSGDEGVDVGVDGETNVSTDYQPGPPQRLHWQDREGDRRAEVTLNTQPRYRPLLTTLQTA